MQNTKFLKFMYKEHKVTEEENRDLCIKKEYYELLKYWKQRPEL